MLTGHLCTFFGKMSIQLLHHFKNCIVFLLLSYKGSLYILSTTFHAKMGTIKTEMVWT